MEKTAQPEAHTLGTFLGFSQCPFVTAVCVTVSIHSNSKSAILNSVNFIRSTNKFTNYVTKSESEETRGVNHIRCTSV